MSTVKISNGHKFYNRGKQNELHVMNNVELELPERGMIAIYGKSGCGKTTLLNAIGGLDNIDIGRIEIFGKDIKSDPDTIRNKYIGYIFQNYNLNVNRTVFENVADALLLCGMDDEDEVYRRVISALSSVGMDKYKNRTPDTLSGGQQQRVAIARAIVKAPAIILADEPTGNLDESNTVLVMDILKEISKTRLVLLVTHEANLVDYYCDKVIEIVDGAVNSIRENECTSGYIERGKNDIYLGELEHVESESDGIKLSRYGELFDEIKLTVVSVNGKLYLRSDTPNLKILDDTSEIKLLDGVFTEKKAEREKSDVIVDMSELTPFEGKRFGRLFRFSSSFKLAIKENLFSGRKKGKRFLRVCLFLLSVVLVFMSAVNALSIKDYFTVKGEHNSSMFYVSLSSEGNYDELSEGVGKNGIKYIKIIDSHREDGVNLTFRAGNFMTASSISLKALADIVDTSVIEGLRVVCGTSECCGDGDLVITTAVADELIKSSTVNYIEEYEDLLGLVSSGGNGVFGSSFRICGVVESDERLYCLNPLSAARSQLGYTYLGMPVSKQSTYKGDIESGSIVVVKDLGYTVGTKVLIAGKNYNVSCVIDPSMDEKYDYTFKFIMNDEDYISLSYTVGKSDDRLGGYYTENFNEDYYKFYLAVYSSDTETTASYLIDRYGESVITPDENFDDMLTEYKGDIIGSLVSVLVVLALMCVCVFFIMRSAFMSRVKEVGILRAVGASKKNILYRFGIETVIITALSVFIGYLLPTVFLFSVSDSAMFDSVFYFPPWLALIMFAVIMLVSLLFGLIPAMMLLRKTPSEILSKYDI